MRRVTLPERPGWRDRAREVGFGFHEMYGEPYWADDVAYLLTLDELEGAIEDPTTELHEMCMDFVGEAVGSEETLSRLLIPAAHHDLVASSWRQGDRHIYGRFDLAYDGTGPAKMLEYNADTPTGTFETAFFQHDWLLARVERGELPADADQFNLVQETLVEAFGTFDHDPATSPVWHFACATDNDEERGTATYLMDCAVQAGHRTQMIDIRRIGIDPAGAFTDEDDRVIDRCFKLYPWEDMMADRFAAHLAPGVFVEPAWKAVLSTKALLPLLWERHPGHPNLLPAWFEGEAAPEAAEGHEVVSKPVHGREGENVTIHSDRASGGATLAETDGTRPDEPRVMQTRAPLFEADGMHAVLGSWVVGDRACGLGIREDRGPITRDLSRFVPHAIVAAAIVAGAAGEAYPFAPMP